MSRLCKVTDTFFCLFFVLLSLSAASALFIVASKKVIRLTVLYQRMTAGFRSTVNKCLRKKKDLSPPRSSRAKNIETVQNDHHFTLRRTGHGHPAPTSTEKCTGRPISSPTHPHEENKYAFLQMKKIGIMFYSDYINISLVTPRPQQPLQQENSLLFCSCILHIVLTQSSSTSPATPTGKHLNIPAPITPFCPHAAALTAAPAAALCYPSPLVPPFRCIT